MKRELSIIQYNIYQNRAMMLTERRESKAFFVYKPGTVCWRIWGVAGCCMLAGLPCSDTGRDEVGCICMPIFECIDAAEVGRIIGLCMAADGDRPIIIWPLGIRPPPPLKESGVDGARAMPIAACICWLLGTPIPIFCMACIIGDDPLFMPML